MAGHQVTYYLYGGLSAIIPVAVSVVAGHTTVQT